MSGSGQANAEDRITFKRWRLGFLAFYCAVIALLGGLAAAVDRPATLISASAPANPAAVATGSIRHTAERRMRE
jgi:hypothetical protein